MLEFIGYIIICWIAADFLTGAFHWWQDRYSQPHWFIIGNLIAKPNLKHHSDPVAFTTGSYFYRNYTTVIPLLILFCITYPSKWSLIFLLGSQANEIHCWSHMKCNWFIRMLQSTGILQSPRTHLAHHKVPFETRFCVMSDWLNPFLDELGFWRGIEYVILKTTGVKPRGN